jgi:triacylglycerol lipase
MTQRIGLSDDANGADTAMTLASIAYCQDIPGALKQYAPQWSCVWLPDAAIKGNYAYIAVNNSADQYVVAIRGSLLEFSWASFYNWFEQDFNVFSQVAWTYPPSSQNPMISQGSADGLTDLSNLVQTNQATGQTTSMLECVLGVAAKDTSLAVVGHSLGGNLATVCAPWLLYQLGQNKAPIPDHFPVMTFAAPTAGNTGFATTFDATFASSWRYYDVLDIVPMASVPESIISMGYLYQPAPQASQISTTFDGMTVTLAEGFALIAGIILGSEYYNGSYYCQTNQTHGGVALNESNMLCPTTETDPLLQWFEEAGCQHGHSNYLSLLGAPQMNCALTLLAP